MSTSVSPFPAIRRALLEHDNLPAFRAGYLALSVIVAALLNLGVFAVLVACHIALDVYKYRSGRSITLAQTARAVLRENLFDLALFCVALLASVSLHYGQIVVIVSGLMRYQESLVRGLVILSAKSYIFMRALKRIEKGVFTSRMPVAALAKPWSPVEVVALSCLALAFVLPLAVLLLPPDVSSLSATLIGLLTPWKL